MREALAQRGQCAFCALNASQQRLPFLLRQLGVRHRSASSYRRTLDKSDDNEGYRTSKFRGSGKTFAFRSSMLEELEKASSFASRPAKKSTTSHGKRPAKPDQIFPPYRTPLVTGRKATAYDTFRELLEGQCDILRNKLLGQDFDRTKAWGITSGSHLEHEMHRFKQKVKDAVDNAGNLHLGTKDANPLFFHLRKAFISYQTAGLYEELKFRFMTFIVEGQYPTEDTARLQVKLADMRYPIEWYPATRALQRTIHLHVGPTNSGKTYHALQRLEAAKSGIYAGPLRLLAHEVYTRFNAKGKKCALITGEEQRIPEGLDVTMNSCTVEMVPLNTVVDCAVIDEIQMLGDDDRGWAWTQAFLGVMAKEVHLCGELRTIPLIQKLCAAMGDKLITHKYQRLGPLEAQRSSLRGDLNKLQKGDAVILFSRVQIHAMKAQIEKTKGKRCAVVYGSLPPETRAQQAALFNDPDNDYDYLVASNAIGMGLNLSIRRVIFESTSKNNGQGHARLEIPEINQIAGRAGRYKSAHDAIKTGAAQADGSSSSPSTDQSKPNLGLVTTLDTFDLRIVQKAMSSKVGPLMSAGIRPPNDIIARFAGLFPAKTPFSYILLRLQNLAVPNPQFHFCRLKEQVEIADLIQPYDLSVTDRIHFISAPVSLRDIGFTEVIVELAQCVSNQTGGELLDLKSLPLELLEQDIHEHQEGIKGYLRKAEMLHKAVTLYLWLSYRFAGVFRSQALAFHVKALVEEKINQCLTDVRFDEGERQITKYLRYKTIKEEAKLRHLIEGTEDLGDRTGSSEEGFEMPEYTPVSDTNITIPEEWEGTKPEAVTSTG